MVNPGMRAAKTLTVARLPTAGSAGDGKRTSMTECAWATRDLRMPSCMQHCELRFCSPLRESRIMVRAAKAKCLCVLKPVNEVRLQALQLLSMRQMQQMRQTRVNCEVVNVPEAVRKVR